MAGGDERHGKEPVAAEVDKFPEGMRVLAVDNDPNYLRALEVLLRHCKYQPTVVMHARTALEMLREGGKDQFDLVITDVHMPDMDGFELLQLIRLEMDLPVIMMSADGDNATVNKGITHGACGYLAKPVRITELKNIWQHAVRKNPGAMNHNMSDNDDDDDADQSVVQPVVVEERGGAKGKKSSKKNKKDGNSSDEKKGSVRVSTTQKKPRVSWSSELHQRFLNAVNLLGADKAYPKTILQMMNVDYLTKGSVASHLQKHRNSLKKAADDASKSNLLRVSSARTKSSSCLEMNHQGGLSDHHAHQREPNVVPIQSRSGVMGGVGHGSSTRRNAISWVPDTRRHHTSCPRVNSLEKISHHPMLDAYSSSHSDKECTDFLRQELLEASNVVPCAQPAGNSFATMPNRGMLEHVNQFPMQPQELLCKHSMVGACCHAQFPCHVRTSSNPRQNFTTTNFHGLTDGTPFFPSSPVPSFEVSPGKVPMFQDEQQDPMVGIINNTTPLAGFSEQMAPFNMESNTTAVEMPSVNFSPITQMVNSGSTSSLMPNLRTGSSVAPPAQMVNGGSINFALPDLHDSSVGQFNGGDATGILHGLVDQETPEYQPNDNNPFFLDEIFATMGDQDFSGDVFSGGEN